MKVRRVLFVAVLVTAFLLLRTLGVIQPTPQCSTPYGVDDTPPLACMAITPITVARKSDNRFFEMR